MTTTVYDQSYDLDERRAPHARMRWSAVFAGLVVSLALWILLYSFGLAAGLTAVDPNDTSSARIAGIGTGVWSLLTPLLALFAGGYVAARVSGVWARREAAMHGLVMWSLVTLFGLFMIGSLLSTVVGSALDVGKAAATSVAQGAAASGTPPSEVAGQAASAARQRLDQLQPQIQERAGEATTGALTTADRAGKAFLGVSIALLLGLIASVLGAAAGVGGRKRRHVVAEQQPTFVPPVATAPAR